MLTTVVHLARWVKFYIKQIPLFIYIVGANQLVCVLYSNHIISNKVGFESSFNIVVIKSTWLIFNSRRRRGHDCSYSFKLTLYTISIREEIIVTEKIITASSALSGALIHRPSSPSTLSSNPRDLGVSSTGKVHGF